MNKTQVLNELLDCYEVSDSLDIPDLCERVWDAAIAHVHPQIEAKTRAECLEQVAAWAINQGFATGHADTLLDLLKELEWQIKVYECKELKK